MPTVSSALLVLSLLFLAGAILSVLAQFLSGGTKNVRAVPALPLFLGYVIIYLVWLAL